MYTQNAKEYVTPKQLEIELQDEVLAHQGRVLISDLQVTSPNALLVLVMRDYENAL